MFHVQFKTFPDALDALEKKLKARTFCPTEYHIVLTPDRYTLEVERKLFSGGGAIDLEVLTLSRLCRRVTEKSKVLSREGGVMLVARAVYALRSKLTYYKKAAGYPDFARAVYDTLTQLASSTCEPEELAATADGVTKQKLADLALIKAEYEKYKAEYRDSQDRLNELMETCNNSELIKRTHFYAIGYSNETKLNLKVFDALAKAAKSFTLFDAYMPEVQAVPMEVYRAPDPITQYKVLASRIREHVFKGGRYGDVSVICPDPKTLARILREYDIDFYYDNATPLDETPPTVALSLIYKIASGDTESEKIITLCKNPFSLCSPADADSLQCEIAASGTEYGAFSREYKSFASKRAIDRIKKLVDIFKSKAAFADACEAVLDEGDFDGIQSSLREKASELSDDDMIFTDTVAPIRSLLEQIRRYGDGESDARSFFSAAHALNVKSLPRYDDRVTVALPETFRLTRCKKLFVTDLNEGVLPIVTGGDGLIGDAEIVATGNKIEPTVRESNDRARAELYSVIKNASEVFCMYHTSGERRSSFLSAVAGPSENDGDYSGECAALKKSGDSSLIARFSCVKNAARELAARNMTSYGDELTAAAGHGFVAKPFTGAVTKHKLKSLSVSELSRWFECPYRRFLSYSVGLSRRASGFEAVDFGTVLHGYMEAFTVKYMQTGVADDSAEFAETVINNELEKLGLTPDEAVRKRIVRDACDYGAANKRVIEAGRYEPKYVEKEFKGDIRLGESAVPFTGKIDRVDEYDGCYRIIDYKTYDRDFDAQKCADGRDMQLPLYAAQEKASTGGEITGFFYMPLAPLYTDDDTLLSGCILNDGDVIRDYDSELNNGERSSVVGISVNKDGNPSTRNNRRLYTDVEMSELINRCVDTASLAADEIESGYIERSPAEGACEKCEFNGLCYNKRNRSGSYD